MDVPSVYPPQYERVGCLSTASSIDVLGVFLPPAEWTCSVSIKLSTTSNMDVLGIFPPSSVWTCRVSFHHHQYERVGCLSRTMSMDVKGVCPPHYELVGCLIPPGVYVDVLGVFPPPAVRMCSMSFHHQQYGRAGCLSTTSNMDVKVSFQHKEYGRAGCTLFHKPTVLVNAEMPDCPA